jgi:trimeric autotransporter adhesin
MKRLCLFLALIPLLSAACSAERKSSNLVAPADTTAIHETGWWDGFRPAPEGQGVDGPVNLLKVFGNDLVVGGQISRVGTIPVDHIALWDGTSWAPMGAGLNDTPLCAVSYRGDLVVGGAFTSAGGAAASHIARWNGASWQPVGTGFDGDVAALAVLEGSLYAGGIFTQAGDAPVSHVARWDGESWTSVGSVPLSEVQGLAVYHRQLMVAGIGQDSVPDAFVSLWVLKWTGSGWDDVRRDHFPFNHPATDGGWDERINQFFTSQDRLVIAGTHGLVAGTDPGSFGNIGQWNGSRWESWSIPLEGDTERGPEIRGMAVWRGEPVALGWFELRDGSGSGIARWDGSTWQPAGRFLLSLPYVDGSSPLGTTCAGAEFKGSFYVGGAFNYVGNTPSRNIARYGD